MNEDGDIKFECKEFNIQDIPLSCTWIIVGPPSSGKTTMIDNMAYYHKHRYPTARIWVGTEGAYKRANDVFHPLYTSNYYDETEHKTSVLRQRICETENGKGYVGNYCITICDDVTDDPKIFKSPVMRGSFKLGSQHWNRLFMLGTQYALDMPPDVRKSVSYIAIFREPEALEREKLYKNFGGLAGSYKNFCKLMDDLTGDYTCLVFKKRSQSNKMEDCIFYYRTKLIPDWKFGCNEYRDWAEKRYNKEYREQFVM